MKILYVGELSAGGSSAMRMSALEKLGQEISALDTTRYNPRLYLAHRLYLSTQMGVGIVRLNRDLLQMAETYRPDVLWADKVLSLWPSTLRKLERMGILRVSYMIDNAFGPRRDPGFRLYKQTVRDFDLHITQRDVSIDDLKQRGAVAAMKVQTAYDRATHFPPPPGWSDADRDRRVSFIGSPFDDRGDFLSRLSDAGVPVDISGVEQQWRRKLSPAHFAKMYRGPQLMGSAYREGIWRSKINLSFVTKANCDEVAHKSFEIAGCQGFLLAERSEGHSAKFVEDGEAVFFSDVAECVGKVRRYLDDEAARNQIAHAGRARAEASGYHNHHQLELMLAEVAKRLSGRRAPARQSA